MKTENLPAPSRILGPCADKVITIHIAPCTGTIQSRIHDQRIGDDQLRYDRSFAGPLEGLTRRGQLCA
eukprot:2416618-Pyramimonas_sp.AAC.1